MKNNLFMLIFFGIIKLSAMETCLTEQATFQAHSQAVTSLAISDDNILYSGSDDKQINKWNLNNFQKLKSLSGHKATVNKLITVGNTLVSSGAEQIKIWDTQTDQEKTINEWGSVNDFTVSKDKLFIGSWSGVTVWDINNCQKLATFYENEDIKAVNHLALSDSDILFYNHVCKSTVHKQNIKTFEKFSSTLENKDSTVHSLAVSDKKLIVGLYGKINIYNQENNVLLTTLEGHQGIVNNLNVVNNLLISSEHSLVKVWDLKNYKLLKTINGNSIYSLAVLASKFRTA